MKIKVYYNKTLGMTEEQISEQTTNAVSGLRSKNLNYSAPVDIEVRGARANMFFDILDDADEVYVQHASGDNQLERGETTAFAFWITTCTTT